MANGQPPLPPGPQGPEGIPGAAGGALPTPGTQDQGNPDLNPVLDALETLQTFVASQKESGNQQADEIGANLLRLIQSIGGNADVPDERGAPPAQAAPPPGPAQPAVRPEMAGAGAQPATPSL